MIKSAQSSELPNSLKYQLILLRSLFHKGLGLTDRPTNHPTSVHRFNQHLTGPYFIQLFHKAQPTHSYMAQMLIIMDVRYDICKICMRFVAYSLWKVRCEVKVEHDLAIEALVGYK